MFKYLLIILSIIFIGCSDCQGCGDKVDAAPQDTDTNVDGGTDAGSDADASQESEDAGLSDLTERVCEAIRVKAF